MTPEQLMTVYPQLDHLMAETLLKLEARGELEKYEAFVEAPVDSSSHVITGAVVVETRQI
jgi:hypothetical protein